MIGTRLKRPCAHCPFRNDNPGFLRRERAAGIVKGLRRHGDFACHKTTRHGRNGKLLPPDKEMQHCAGAMILLVKEQCPNILMRLRMMSGELDLQALDMSAPVFDSFDEFTEHHNA